MSRRDLIDPEVREPLGQMQMPYASCRDSTSPS